MARHRPEPSRPLSFSPVEAKIFCRAWRRRRPEKSEREETYGTDFDRTTRWRARVWRSGCGGDRSARAGAGHHSEINLRGRYLTPAQKRGRAEDLRTGAVAQSQLDR